MPSSLLARHRFAGLVCGAVASAKAPLRREGVLDPTRLVQTIAPPHVKTACG